MPNWEGIEDAAPKASRVWFSRSKETDDWKPLRKKDCQILNEQLALIETKQEVDLKLQAYIEEGRSTVTLDASKPSCGIITYNFVRGRQRELCSAIWFVKNNDNSKEIKLDPIYENERDSEMIEELYQKAVQASSSLGKGISSMLNESIPLTADESTVMIVKTGTGNLKIVKKAKGWFGTQYDLQRGYGEYSVEGEEEETTLGPVGHLCFVIHGIGEAYFSKEEVNMSLIDIMNTARIEIHKKQVDEWKKECQTIQHQSKKEKKTDEPELPAPPPRIEFIPIEWFNRLHDSSSMLMKSLRSATLPTIPALRSIANDIIFDVLLYLTPNFCETVLECVTTQINAYHQKFCTIHADFHPTNCSLIGHSLGSVIAWDLLSILKDKQIDDRRSQSARGVTLDSEVRGCGGVGYQAYARDHTADQPQKHAGTWGPTLTKPMEKTIPFVPYTTIFLGSPLGIFLTLRGAHAVFDEQRLNAIEKAKIAARSNGTGKDSKEKIRIPSSSPFTLPTKSLYNIFHASDPVAYRIEPLLLSQELDMEKLPPPVYLTAPGKDVRLHVKARQIGSEFVRTLQLAQASQQQSSSDSSKSTAKSPWSAFMGSTITALGGSGAALEPSSTDGKVDERGEGPNTKVVQFEPEWPPTFPLGNPSNPTKVDYSFQPAFVENEYLNAVTAHSSYFSNADLIDFLVRRLNVTWNDVGDNSKDYEDGANGVVASVHNL